jgi:hypothetical protein
MSRHTLTSQKDSTLEALFSGRHFVEKDDSGRYFIDRDGDMFKYVLCFLRAPHKFTLEGLSPRDILRVREEFEYFQLPSVVPTGTVSSVVVARYAREHVRIGIQNENNHRRVFFRRLILRRDVQAGFVTKICVRFPPSTTNEDEPPYVSCEWSLWTQHSDGPKILLPCAVGVDGKLTLNLTLQYLRILAKYYGITVDESIMKLPMLAYTKNNGVSTNGMYYFGFSCDDKQCAGGNVQDFAKLLEFYRIGVALNHDLFGILDGQY